ncbi:MAG: hypothetical protein WC375_00395 [Methanomassiliicoccales archaeon]|jgi:hypothetical protein
MNPMKQVYFFSVTDIDVTTIIYNLLFAELYCNIQGNDLVYEIEPWDQEGSNAEGDNKPPTQIALDAWENQIAKGMGSLYCTNEEKNAFIENPPTLIEAYKHFADWLREKGVPESVYTVYVKISW